MWNSLNFYKWSIKLAAMTHAHHQAEMINVPQVELVFVSVQSELAMDGLPWASRIST